MLLLLSLFLTLVMPSFGFAAKECDGNKLVGECYRIKDGKLWAYGNFSEFGADVVFAEFSSNSGFSLTRSSYGWLHGEYKFDRTLIKSISATSPKYLSLDDPKYRSGIKKIELPSGTISDCAVVANYCFKFERTKTDIYYGTKFRQTDRVRRQGYGLMLTNEGSLYVGYFKADQPHGKGHLMFFGGEEYVGNFAKGKFSGEGIFYYSSGKQYRGGWEDNKMHGFGAVYDKNGSFEYSGSWVLGEKPKPDIQSDVQEVAQPEKVSGSRSHRAKAVRARISRIQQEMIYLGFLKGPADGVSGPLTRGAMLRLVAEIPSVHHGSMSSLNWTNITELEVVINTLKRYVARPEGECPIDGFLNSLCFD